MYRSVHVMSSSASLRNVRSEWTTVNGDPSLQGTIGSAPCCPGARLFIHKTLQIAMEVTKRHCDRRCHQDIFWMMCWPRTMIHSRVPFTTGRRSPLGPTVSQGLSELCIHRRPQAGSLCWDNSIRIESKESGGSFSLCI